MDVSHINTTVLRKLLSLSEKKESLLLQIKEIEAQISGFATGSAASTVKTGPKKGGKVSRSSGKRGKRGLLKEQILALLTAAGESGAKVKDIASHLGINPQNIHVWFSSTGKKLGVIKRVDAGHYKIAGKSEEKASAPAAAKAPAKKKKVKPAKKKAAAKK